MELFTSKTKFFQFLQLWLECLALISIICVLIPPRPSEPAYLVDSAWTIADLQIDLASSCLAQPVAEKTDSQNQPCNFDFSQPTMDNAITTGIIPTGNDYQSLACL